MEQQVFDLLSRISTQIYNIYLYETIIHAVDEILTPVFAVLAVYILCMTVSNFIKGELEQ